MYIVTLKNNGVATEIHGEKEKLMSGKVVKGINSIDTFSFSLLPSNIGFNLMRDFMTLVEVYNTNKRRYEFYGRVLYSDTGMDESGLITKDVTCESYFGFLCDSQQEYVAERNWTVAELFTYIINKHNEQLEEYKQFEIGEVTVTDPNDNLYCGIQRENTWETLKKKLIEVLGGEIRFRVENGINYIDYLVEIGEHRQTEIAVSRNMKSITQEKDPSAYITRLIPLGCKLTTTDENGEEVESEERLDISSVNGGKKYLDDEQAIEEYGLHIGYVEWDDVTEPANLKAKGEQWLAENNKVKIKYSITALDLSLLGLDIDDFEVHDYYPIKNHLLGIDDVARITKETLDICEEIKSTIEVGEQFKTLSDIQLEQSAQVAAAASAAKKIESDSAKIVELGNKTAEQQVKTETLSEQVEENTLNIEDILARLALIENALPQGFTLLEYIESSGTQYIDTGFIPNQDTRVIWEGEYSVSSSANWLFGVRQSATVGNFSFLTVSSYFRSDYGSDYQKQYSTAITKATVVDKNKNVTTVNGTEVVSSTYAAFTCPGHLMLFANNNNGTVAGHSTAKTKSIQIYDNDTLVRDYVPCINVNGDYGLFDKINRQFYANAGTGAFTGA